jgi:NADPH:quinone reductase
MTLRRPDRMAAWWMHMDATASQLELREMPVPQPGPGQVLVHMRAASLNRGEFLLGHGLHGASGSWKAIGGEGAGEIKALGEGVERLSVGQRVMGRCTGAFAEYALMQADEAMPLPERLSWIQGAAVPLTFLVAYDMLVQQGQLVPQQWVLINGVSSGVGVASLQLAKALGARVIGTSGSQAKIDVLTPMGLDFGLVTREPDFSQKVMAITQQHGADLIVNTVGGSVLMENLRAASFEARLAVVGYVDGVVRAELDLEMLHAKRLRMYGVSNKLRSQAQRAAAIPAFARDVLPALSDGRITPQIDSIFAFDDLPKAKAHMEAARHLGKIVLSMDR